jgi:hypothetical protein
MTSAARPEAPARPKPPAPPAAQPLFGSGVLGSGAIGALLGAVVSIPILWDRSPPPPPRHAPAVVDHDAGTGPDGTSPPSPSGP